MASVVEQINTAWKATSQNWEERLTAMLSEFTRLFEENSPAEAFSQLDDSLKKFREEYKRTILPLKTSTRDHIQSEIILKVDISSAEPSALYSTCHTITKLAKQQFDEWAKDLEKKLNSVLLKKDPFAQGKSRAEWNERLRLH